MNFFLVLSLTTFLCKRVNSRINITRNGSYIGIYDSETSRNWFESSHYCMENFGSTLATINSYEENMQVVNARSRASSVWVGCNDFGLIDGTFKWSSNGENLTYTKWYLPEGEPNNLGGEDCCQFYGENRNFTWNDYTCEKPFSSFVCDSDVTWRPIFKIIDNIADYGNTSNVYEYWMNGNNNYNTYNDDIDYIMNGGFNKSSIDDGRNYRSLIIDDWNEYVENNAFELIKIELYKDNSLAAYYVFEPTIDKLSWFDSSHYIIGSYRDLLDGESYSVWNISGDSSGDHFWQIWYDSINCSNAYGWLMITQDSSCTNWNPQEGTTIPQIRYSIAEYAYAGYIKSIMTDNTNVLIADTFVVSVKVNNISQLRIDTIEPTQIPSMHPTSVPTNVPSNLPSNVPTNVPTDIATNNSTFVASNFDTTSNGNAQGNDDNTIFSMIDDWKMIAIVIGIILVLIIICLCCIIVVLLSKNKKQNKETRDAINSIHNNNVITINGDLAKTS